MNLLRLSLVLLLAAPQTQVASTPDGGSLQSLLHALDRYADLYRDSALRFACDEVITYSPSGPGGKKLELEYIYVYTPEAGLTDYRTRRGDSSKKKLGSEVNLAASGLPSFVERGYSWVFTFERGKWPLHRYKVIGKAKILERDAIEISFEPLPPYKTGVNDWFGEAWIDGETRQLLKIEAFQVDQHLQKTRLDADLAQVGPLPAGKLPAYFISKVTTEFAEEKNGLRFPSRVEIRRSRFDIHNQDGHRYATEHLGFRIQQEYSNYRFFSVRTLDEVRTYVKEK